MTARKLLVLICAGILIVVLVKRYWPALAGFKRVFATREGLIGRRTASGRIMTSDLLCVALPSVDALGAQVHVINESNGLAAIVPCLDVGPWNTHDDAYVFGNARPAAERAYLEGGVDEFGRHPSNPSGIDLSDALVAQLKGGGAVGFNVYWLFVG